MVSSEMLRMLDTWMLTLTSQGFTAPICLPSMRRRMIGTTSKEGPQGFPIGARRQPRQDVLVDVPGKRAIPQGNHKGLEKVQEKLGRVRLVSHARRVPVRRCGSLEVGSPVNSRRRTKERNLGRLEGAQRGNSAPNTSWPWGRLFCWRRLGCIESIAQGNGARKWTERKCWKKGFSAPCS